MNAGHARHAHHPRAISERWQASAAAFLARRPGDAMANLRAGPAGVDRLGRALRGPLEFGQSERRNFPLRFTWRARTHSKSATLFRNTRYPPSGAISLNGVNGARLAALTNILGLPYTNMQAQAYAGVAEHSINTGALLNNAIARSSGAQLFHQQCFPPKSPHQTAAARLLQALSAQLKMVARLIEAGIAPRAVRTTGSA